VNKIEADVYVPEEYSYLGFRGTLHARPANEPLSNTLAWINALRQQRGVAAIDRPPPVLGAFVTEGRRLSFHTLAPVGTISLNYCDRKLFWVFCVLLPIAAILAGVLLTRKKSGVDEGKGPRGGMPRVAPLWVCLALVLVPLCLRWFSTSDAKDLFTSWLVGGLLLSAGFVLLRIGTVWRAWREERLARAPDPFLEEAPDKSPSTPPPPQEPKPEAAAGGAGAPAGDAGGEKPAPEAAPEPKPETEAGQKPEAEQPKDTGGEEQK
jgi:hypothetical protein